MLAHLTQYKVRYGATAAAVLIAIAGYLTGSDDAITAVMHVVKAITG